MEEQKQAVIDLVVSHRGQGRTVGDVLGSVGVARSSYYRWKKKPGREKTPSTQFVRDHGRGTKIDRGS